jgi:hypothetical protein
MNHRSEWFHEHRAQYNRWADRHTILLWSSVAVLLGCLIIVTAARLSHPLPPSPQVSSTPQPGQGQLP